MSNQRPSKNSERWLRAIEAEDWTTLSELNPQLDKEEVKKVCRERWGGLTPLVIAAIAHKKEVMLYLLNNGWDPDEKSLTGQSFREMMMQSQEVSSQRWVLKQAWEAWQNYQHLKEVAHQDQSSLLQKNKDHRL